MDLYIRSKDRMQIEKMRRIAFQPNEEFNFHTGKSKQLDIGCILVNGRDFGEYTQEQALKILNDIQCILTPQIIQSPRETISVEDTKIFTGSPTPKFLELGKETVIQDISTILYELPIPEEIM